MHSWVLVMDNGKLALICTPMGACYASTEDEYSALVCLLRARKLKFTQYVELSCRKTCYISSTIITTT